MTNTRVRADFATNMRDRLTNVIKSLDARDIDTALRAAKWVSRMIRERNVLNVEIADYIDVAVDILEQDPRYINEPKAYLQEAINLTYAKEARMRRLVNKRADALSGPAAPTERNPSSFNRACPVCGWESQETIEGCSTKFAKCPKCGSDFDQQPFVINTQPAELELLTPRVGKEKTMNKAAQAVKTNVDTSAIVQMLLNQGIDPEDAQKAADMIANNQKQKQQGQPTQPQSPMTPMTPMQPVGSKLSDILKKMALGDEPGRITFGPGYEPPRLAEADEDKEIDLFDADEDEEDEEKEDEESEEITSEEMHELGEKIGINWEEVEFTADALLEGYKHELEHGTKDPETNVTNDDPEETAKIAWVHLKEDPEYYTKLNQMEEGADSEGDEDEEGEEDEEATESKGTVGPEKFGLEKPDQEVQAAMRKRAITIRELQDVVLPQLEEDFLHMDAALQSGEVEAARERLYDASSRFYLIRDAVRGLGDVDPMVINPKEDGGFLSKLGL
jgi:hypothetical protein